MKIDLTGKTALVTGSSAGIGRATVRGLAAAGARVIVNGRREASVQKAVAALRAELPAASIQGISADVGNAQGCAGLVRAIDEVDILVNNAGIFEPKDFFQIEDSDWMRFFEINVMSGSGCRAPTCPACSGATGAGSCSSLPNRACTFRKR
jgi:NAD(P)-dependent dehydrogenase (short-subunit alcohol dehydrogenase family)